MLGLKSIHFSKRGPVGLGQVCARPHKKIRLTEIHPCSKVIGIFLQCQKVVFKLIILISYFTRCIIRWFGMGRYNFIIFRVHVCYLYLSKVSKVRKMWCLIDRWAEIKTNIQSVVKEICPHESVEHHREHRHRNREIKQLCLGPISKYGEISCRCIAWHYPVWAGCRSWVRRHRSLHITITGDEVRAHSCLIFK